MPEMSAPQTRGLDNVSRVVEVLKIAADALISSAERLDPAQLERAIHLLANCRGKVVVAGVGKSGLVARKIASTLTSTGTAAVYLHPADALHGDLGIVTTTDVVVALSNSGETDELIAMLPHLKHRNVPIIAIVGGVKSTLARSADVVLDASVKQEACPLNLAPTTSTIVALAIGDALAATLIEVKGITSADFALNHPAGRMGKRLTLRVSDLMHSGPDNPTVLPGASWLMIAGTISKGGLGAVNVVDDAGRLAGIITDGDLRRSLEKVEAVNLEKLTANQIMTKNPIVVSPEALAYDALQLMENRPSQIAVLPVVDADRNCLGLIRIHDIVRSGL
jgi:arabinose-5-phosphate isomerase